MANDGAPSAPSTPQGMGEGQGVNNGTQNNRERGGNANGHGQGNPGGGNSQRAPQDPTAKTFERVKIKVDGREEEVDFETLKASYSKSKAADRRFEEAATKSKRADALENALKEGDFSKMLELGLSKEKVRDLMERFYHREFIEPESLTEDQRRLRAAEARLKDFESAEQKRQADKEAQENDRLDGEARDSLTRELAETLDKSGLKKSRFNMARIAYWTKQNIKRGWDAPQEVIINQVKKEREDLVRSLLESHEDESIFSVLGEKVSDRIRKLDLERLRKKRNLPAQSSEQSTPRQSIEREPTSKKTLDDVDAEIRNMFRRKR